MEQLTDCYHYCLLYCSCHCSCGGGFHSFRQYEIIFKEHSLKCIGNLTILCNTTKNPNYKILWPIHYFSQLVLKFSSENVEYIKYSIQYFTDWVYDTVSSYSFLLSKNNTIDMELSGMNLNTLMNNATMKTTDDWLARKHYQYLMTW